ncbi:MAG: hypothetical protein JSR77_09535 [Planctomycetes bacterium]|nr:hypothetical protein [Planctomycetota bacterium]
MPEESLAPGSAAPPRRSPAATVGVWLMALALCVISVGVVVAPLAITLAHAASSASSKQESAPPPPNWPTDAITPWALLGNTLAWSIGIACLATVLAAPAAWVIRARGWRSAPIILVPLLLPTYLTYASLNLARAPGTMLGDWIERSAQAGYKELPIIAGKVLALLGLGLWAWPIAALVMAAAWRSIDQGMLDVLRMEQAGLGRRAAVMCRLLAPGALPAMALVAMIMLGSAVPLHLAQVRTYALEVWFLLTLKPGNAQAWVTAWPVIAVALCASVVLTRRLCEERRDEIGHASAGRVRSSVTVASAAIWACATILPLGLYARSLVSWRSVALFLRLAEEPLESSGVVAAAVGGIAGMIVCGAWIGLSQTDPRVRALVQFSIGAFLLGGLMPGVLVGTAVRTAFDAWPALRSLADSPFTLGIGHLARFGCVAVLAGCFLAANEPREQRGMRQVDGATGVHGWLGACLRADWAVVVGTGVACACLSLHEIEAAVILQPPGTPSLAQLLLGYLHFAKTQEMSAAAVVLVSGGVIVAVAAAVIARNAQSVRRGTARAPE